MRIVSFERTSRDAGRVVWRDGTSAGWSDHAGWPLLAYYGPGNRWRYRRVEHRAKLKALRDRINSTAYYGA